MSSAGSRSRWWGVLETGDPVGGGGEQDPLPNVAGGDAEGDRHVGFPGAGRSEKDHVAGLGEVVAGGEGRDVVAADSWLVVEVELVEGFVGGEAGGADAQLRPGGVAGGDFSVEDGDEVVLMGPAGVSGLSRQPGRGIADPGGLQGGGEVADLLGGVTHEATCSWSRSTPNARS